MAETDNARPAADRVLVVIADYVVDGRIDSALDYETARNCPSTLTALMRQLPCARERNRQQHLRLVSMRIQ